MFTDLDRNKEMIIGSYLKVKKHFNYNKNFVFMKKKVAEFEYDDKKFDESVMLLAKMLKNPENYSGILKQWIESIGVYILPKGFQHVDDDPMVIRGIKNDDVIVNKVNFFIDIPIELYILDVLWTVIIGKEFCSNNILSGDIYGNVINFNVVYNKEPEFIKSINFRKSSFFKSYFNQYCSWKNNAIRFVDEAYNKNINTVLISLDIKGYYYSIDWSFDFLKKYLSEDVLHKLSPLTDVISRVYEKYHIVLKQYRKLDQKSGKTVLPIGLFSSMHLSNLYLKEFDDHIRKISNVIYYGRYVDDMLILLNVDNFQDVKEKDFFDNTLLNGISILEQKDDKDYCLQGYSNLIIQKQKVKFFFFERAKAKALISKLKNTKIIPSGCNVIPSDKIDITDFEQDAYMISDLVQNTKIRDIGQMKVDSFKLARHMSQLVRFYADSTKGRTNKEKNENQEEIYNILEFFNGANACEYSSNWTNALYFIIETSKNPKYWKMFEKNIKKSIRQLRVNKIEDVKNGNEVKRIIKTNLEMQLGICLSTALALNPYYNDKQEAELISLACKIRKANMFNHYLVKYPLLNYVDNLDDDIDLMTVSIDKFYLLTAHIGDNRKVLFSPRFVHLEELFHFAFLYYSQEGGNPFYKEVESRISKLRELFYKLNNIYDRGKGLPVRVENSDRFEGYRVQMVKAINSDFTKSKFKVAIANLPLSIKRSCYSLNQTRYEEPKFSQLITILKEANDAKNIDFLLLPEFYLPISWVADVLSFVRKTGIVVITGLQYIVNKSGNNGVAHNNLAVFLPLQSSRYKSACMLAREKNDYAPMEKNLLALNGCICNDQIIPTYNIFEIGNMRFGTFLCYEFTDIVARSLYKNKVDILFTPEYNKDTSYFSSIIESLVRDLHVFIAQANTSIYGDSRITGPFDKYNRNVIQIKGGENDILMIGTINLGLVKEQEKQQADGQMRDLTRYLSMSPSKKKKEFEKIIREGRTKVEKVSARFK